MNIYRKQYIEAHEIPLAMELAFNHFNKTFYTNYSLANVHIAYFTFDNFPAVYQQLCVQYFPSWLAENYTNPNFYMDTQASALVEGNHCGILINTSIQFSFYEWAEALTHELSHIYAVQHEFGGQDFYRQCCCDPALSPNEDMLYVGYSVWKEFIADYMTLYAAPYKAIYSLYRYRGEIKRFDQMITNLHSRSLKAMSLVLVCVFTSKEFLSSESWEDFWQILQKKELFNSYEYKSLLEVIFTHLRSKDSEAHIINEDFIDTLGSLVRCMVVDRNIKGLARKVTW